MILSRCLHKTASTLPIDLMLEVRVLIAIILNLKGHFQSEYNKCQNAFWGTWVFFFCPHPPSMFRPRRPKCFSWSGFHFSHSERRKAEAERDVEALLIVGKLVSGGGITSKDASSRQIPPKVLFLKVVFAPPTPSGGQHKWGCTASSRQSSERRCSSRRNSQLEASSLPST